MKKIGLLIIQIFFLSSITYCTTYYSILSGEINTKANWNSSRDGSGSPPISFTTSGDVFVIQGSGNGGTTPHSMTTIATITIGPSSGNSKLWIENGATLTETYKITLTAVTTFQIDNGGTYILDASIALQTGILVGIEVFGASSNFILRGGFPTSMSAPTSPGFGNFTVNISGTGGSNTIPSGALAQIQGDLTIQSTGTTGRFALVSNSPASLSVAIGGNLNINSGNFYLTAGTAIVNMTVSGDVSITNGILDLANKVLSVASGTLNIGGNFSQTGGTLTATNSQVMSNINLNGVGKTFTETGSLTNTNINWGIGTGASISLNNDLNVAASRTLTLSGIIVIGTHNLTITALGSISGASSSSYIVTDNSGFLIQNVSSSPSVLFPIGPTTSSYNPVTLTNNGTSDNYSVNVAAGIGAHASGTNVVNRIWNIVEGASGGSNLITTFQWNSGDETGGPYNHNLFTIGVDNGAIYDHVVSGAVQDLGSGQYSITNSDNSLTLDLSGTGKTLMVGEGTSLPVELSTFTSNLNGRTVQLIWETKTEKNSNKFDIERSLAVDNNWVSIGSVKAADLSNSVKQYSFTDKNLQAGTYQYRLKMIDNDGTYEFSKVLESVISIPKNFELNQNYPNPFNPSTKISYSLPNDSKVVLDIYNLIGERIGQLVNKDQSAGYYSVDFSNASVNKLLTSGIYLYRIQAVDKLTGKEFSSIKKMVLLK